jgi:hypothetical protein
VRKSIGSGTDVNPRSGKKSTPPLLYFTNGEDAIVVASNYGRRTIRPGTTTLDPPD